jgi:hypothetical protein
MMMTEKASAFLRNVEHEYGEHVAMATANVLPDYLSMPEVWERSLVRHLGEALGDVTVARILIERSKVMGVFKASTHLGMVLLTTVTD